MLHVHCCRCLCRPLISLKYLRKWWFCQSLEWNWETHSASLQTNFSYCPKNMMNQLQVTFALVIKSISIKQHYNVVGCLFNLNCLQSFSTYVHIGWLSYHTMANTSFNLWLKLGNKLPVISIVLRSLSSGYPWLTPSPLSQFSS